MTPNINTMPKEIRILFVEDVPSDAVIVNHCLRQGGLVFSSRRVDTKQGFLHELKHHPPDVILSDHGLPSFDGFTALAIARDQCPDVPFIFVTNSMGEDLAIAAFESGASDCVLKHRLAKLAPAIRRALRGADKRMQIRQKERELRESEERLRMFMDGVRDYAMFMLDANGQVTSWNAGAQWIHGYHAAEVSGRHFSLFYTPEDIARRHPARDLKTAAAKGRFEEEGVRLAKGGKRFWANVVISALHDATGTLRGFAQVTRDITERKEAEEALRRSEALKSGILDTALDAILSIDHGGLVQEWNPAAHRILGYSRAEALGKPLDSLIIPAGLREIYKDGLTSYLMDGSISLLNRPIELTLRRADRSEFQAELAITRIPTEEPPRCTLLIRDISERKKAEAELRESEERFRQMVDEVRDYAIYMLDAEGRVATWNAGAERTEGYRSGEVMGKPFSIFFTSADVQQGVPARALRKAELEGQVTSEGWRVRKNGSRFWSQGIITALRDETGKLRGFSKIAHDITRQKEAEEEIRRLNDELEQRVRDRTSQLETANQELEAFSYSVSHDLRAPLRHILGYVEILQGQASRLDKGSRHHLRTITKAAREMGDLIDALLEFSRMGRADLSFERISLATLVKEARHQLRRESKGRRIKWKIGELPEVQGDPVMLRQVIINLLSNALKFTRTRVRAQIEIGTTQAEGQTVCFIRDNGVGFDMQYANKLFGVFQRLHSGRDFEGNGIGLANVRRILNRHGGRAWAEGAVGHGATFYFSLPNPQKGWHAKPKMGHAGEGEDQ